jgi:hypothetical protein
VRHLADANAANSFLLGFECGNDDRKKSRWKNWLSKPKSIVPPETAGSFRHRIDDTVSSIAAKQSQFPGELLMLTL